MFFLCVFFLFLFLGLPFVVDFGYVFVVYLLIYFVILRFYNRKLKSRVGGGTVSDAGTSALTPAASQAPSHSLSARVLSPRSPERQLPAAAGGGGGYEV